MSRPVYISSQVSTVTGTSQEFGTALTARSNYVLVANVNCWFKVSATGGTAAVSTADSHLYIAGQERLIQATEASQFVQIVKDTGEADGRACLSELVE